MLKYRLPNDYFKKIFHREIKIDKDFVNHVEKKLGYKALETIECYRSEIRKIFAQKIGCGAEPDYDFLDRKELVKAVSEVMEEWEELSLEKRIMVKKP